MPYLISGYFAAIVETGAAAVAGIDFAFVQGIRIARIVSTAVFGTAASFERSLCDYLVCSHQVFSPHSPAMLVNLLH